MSAIFDAIATHQKGHPWGHVLDAGTGVASMRWLSRLRTDRVTAVTGSESMARRIRGALSDLRDRDRIVVGNWNDPAFLAGESFDVVVADYLIGAVDAFAPYAQDALLRRLARACRHRFYLVGLQPYVVDKPQDEAGELVWRIGRLRDAVLLLVGHRPYREFPIDWTLRHMQSAGLRILDSQRFPIRYRDRFIDGQLRMCEDRLPLIRNSELRNALQYQVASLRDEAHEAAERLGGLRHGFDYVISAAPTAT